MVRKRCQILRLCNPLIADASNETIRLVPWRSSWRNLTIELSTVRVVERESVSKSVGEFHPYSLPQPSWIKSLRTLKSLACGNSHVPSEKLIESCSISIVISPVIILLLIPFRPRTLFTRNSNSLR